MTNSKEFSAERYLTLLHQNSDLSQFQKHVQQLRTTIKSKAHSYNQLHQLVANNFETFWTAKRMLEGVQASLETVGFYHPNLQTILDTSKSIRVEAQQDILTLKNIHTLLKEQNQADTARHKVQGLLLVCNDVLLHLQNPMLFQQSDSLETITRFLLSSEPSVKAFYAFYHSRTDPDLISAHISFRECMDELQDKFCEHFVSTAPIKDVKERYQLYFSLIDSLIKCLAHQMHAPLDFLNLKAKLLSF